VSGQPNPLDVLRHGLDRYEWARDRDAEDEALAQVETLVEAAKQTGEPIMDDRFRSRLLRHALSNDEIEQFVEAFESSQSNLRAALAPFVGQPGDETT
jgi:hypothetical protein